MCVCVCVCVVCVCACVCVCVKCKSAALIHVTLSVHRKPLSSINMYTLWIHILNAF